MLHPLITLRDMITVCVTLLLNPFVSRSFPFLNLVSLYLNIARYIAGDGNLGGWFFFFLVKILKVESLWTLGFFETLDLGHRRDVIHSIDWFRPRVERLAFSLPLISKFFLLHKTFLHLVPLFFYCERYHLVYEKTSSVMLRWCVWRGRVFGSLGKRYLRCEL